MLILFHQTSGFCSTNPSGSIKVLLVIFPTERNFKTTNMGKKCTRSNRIFPQQKDIYIYVYIYILNIYIYIIHITMKFKDQSWKNYSGLKYWFSSPFHWQSFQHLPPSKRWGRWSLHTWGREAPCWSSTAQRHDPQQVPLGSINSLYRGWSGPTFNDGNPYNGAL